MKRRLKQLLKVEDQMMLFYLDEETDEMFVSVVCGGIGMYMVHARIHEDERDRIQDPWYQKWIGGKIRKQKEQIADRIVDLKYEDVEIYE